MYPFLPTPHLNPHELFSSLRFIHAHLLEILSPSWPLFSLSNQGSRSQQTPCSAFGWYQSTLYESVMLNLAHCNKSSNCVSLSPPSLWAAWVHGLYLTHLHPFSIQHQCLENCRSWEIFNEKGHILARRSNIFLRKVQISYLWLCGSWHSNLNLALHHLGTLTSSACVLYGHHTQETGDDALLGKISPFLV